VRALLTALALVAAAAPTASACCVRAHLFPPGKRHSPHPLPLAIGDSVMLGAARNIARAGFEVDAREGRFMRSALRILRTRRRTGRRPRVVVVGIGTNAPATHAEIARALRLLGPRAKLALVTPKRSWRGIDNGAIRLAKRRHPRRVQVLDWVAYSARHPEWFWNDGTHLRPAGARAYTRLVRRALRPRQAQAPRTRHAPAAAAPA
jgi:hypothetical protein